MQNGLRWRARIRYLVLSALVVGLVASAATAAVKSQGQKRFVIGYAGAILSNPSVKANEDGVKAQAAKYGMEVVSTDANFNASKQISDIDTLIQRGVDAILMVPVNSQAVEPALQRARAKNIIVISREGEGRDPWTSAFNGTNFDSASAAAFFMAKRLGRGAKVAVIDGNPSTGLLRARNEGFRDGAKKAGLDVVNSQVNFLVNRGIQLNVGHRYINGNPVIRDSNQLNFGGYFRMGENWGFSFREQYEFERSTLQSQRYELHRDLSSWVASLGFLARNNGGVNEFGMLLTFTLKDIPSARLPIALDPEGTTSSSSGKNR